MRLMICKPAYSHYMKVIRALVAAFAVLVMFLATYFGLWDNIGAIVLVIMAGVVLALALAIYIKVTHDSVTYEATDGELVKTEGLLTKHTMVVSYSKISNVSTRRDLLERFFGLGTIFVDTTGGGPGFELTMKHLGAKDMAQMMGIINDMLQKGELDKASPPQAGYLAPARPAAPPPWQPVQDETSTASAQQPAPKKPLVRELPPPIDDFATSEREHLELLESEAYLKKHDEHEEDAAPAPPKTRKQHAKKSAPSSRRRSRR
jgi:membrane protein YdbS with pleckstrin-like domain